MGLKGFLKLKLMFCRYLPYKRLWNLLEDGADYWENHCRQWFRLTHPPDIDIPCLRYPSIAWTSIRSADVSAVRSPGGYGLSQLDSG